MGRNLFKNPQSIWHPVYIYSHYTIHDHCIKFLHNTVLILFLHSTGFVLCDWIWSLAIEFISDIVKLNSTSVTTRVWLIEWRVGWSMSLLTVYICKLLPRITMLLNLVMDWVPKNCVWDISHTHLIWDICLLSENLLLCLILRFFPYSCLGRPISQWLAQAALREKSTDETQQQILRQQLNVPY